MALDTIQFVDSIAASPTVRLDLNVLNGWRVLEFDPGVPEFRRALSSNAMRDGVYVSSSSYGERTATITLIRTSSAADTNATSIQNLARELDRPTNYLRFIQDGATKAVFFTTYRSAPSALAYMWQSALADNRVTIPILCDPLLLGERETVSVGTVNNDPAAGSNGCYFDVSSVKGDVATPLILTDSATTIVGRALAVRQHDTPSDMPALLQCEAMTISGSGALFAAGATFSGAGNNAVQCLSGTPGSITTTVLSYSPTTDAQRNAMRGMFRVLVVLKRSGSSADISAQMSYSALYTDVPRTADVVTLPLTSGRQIVDMGIASFGMGDKVGRHGAALPPMPIISLAVARTGAAETVDFDHFILLPVDECSLRMDTNGTFAAAAAGLVVIDGEQQRVYGTDSSVRVTADDLAMSGGFPLLVPNQTNRFIWYYYATGVGDGIDKTWSGTLTGYYYPRYMFIRPSAS